MAATIAAGHPFGMTGARITSTLINVGGMSSGTVEVRNASNCGFDPMPKGSSVPFMAQCGT